VHVSAENVQPSPQNIRQLHNVHITFDLHFSIPRDKHSLKGTMRSIWRQGE